MNVHLYCMMCKFFYIYFAHINHGISCYGVKRNVMRVKFLRSHVVEKIILSTLCLYAVQNSHLCNLSNT
ncbi:hypothetical protein X975_04644, partial [Stegodyphus mimosarum]